MAQGLRKLPRSEFGGITVQTEDVHNDLKRHHWVIPCSFETGEQNTLKVYCTQACLVDTANAQVQKALAATDAGTITIKDSGGNTKATISFSASAAVNTEVNGTVTAFTVAAGDFFQVIAAKTTAGGKAILQVAGVRNGGG